MVWLLRAMDVVMSAPPGLAAVRGCRRSRQLLSLSHAARRHADCHRRRAPTGWTSSRNRAAGSGSPGPPAAAVSWRFHAGHPLAAAVCKERDRRHAGGHRCRSPGRRCSPPRAASGWRSPTAPRSTRPDRVVAEDRRAAPEAGGHGLHRRGGDRGRGGQPPDRRRHRDADRCRPRWPRPSSTWRHRHPRQHAVGDHLVHHQVLLKRLHRRPASRCGAPDGGVRPAGKPHTTVATDTSTPPPPTPLGIPAGPSQPPHMMVKSEPRCAHLEIAEEMRAACIASTPPWPWTWWPPRWCRILLGGLDEGDGPRPSPTRTPTPATWCSTSPGRVDTARACSARTCCWYRGSTICPGRLRARRRPRRRPVGGFAEPPGYAHRRERARRRAIPKTRSTATGMPWCRSTAFPLPREVWATRASASTSCGLVACWSLPRPLLVTRRRARPSWAGDEASLDRLWPDAPAGVRGVGATRVCAASLGRAVPAAPRSRRGRTVDAGHAHMVLDLRVRRRGGTRRSRHRRKRMFCC